MTRILITSRHWACAYTYIGLPEDKRIKINCRGRNLRDKVQTHELAIGSIENGGIKLKTLDCYSMKSLTTSRARNHHEVVTGKIPTLQPPKKQLARITQVSEKILLCPESLDK
jgi:hypothetical protein